MEHLKRITSQQLVMAAAAATLTGAVMLSQHKSLGLLPLVIAALCGIAAYLKSPGR
jgi:hypothetical protein